MCGLTRDIRRVIYAPSLPQNSHGLHKITEIRALLENILAIMGENILFSVV
jgi:hypothetical protein